MLESLIVAVIYCVIVLLITWALILVCSLLPIPAPMAGIFPNMIWIIAIIICLIIMLRVVINVPLPGALWIPPLIIPTIAPSAEGTTALGTAF